MQNKICSHDQDRRPVLRGQFFYNTSAYFPSKLPFFFAQKPLDRKRLLHPRVNLLLPRKLNQSKQKIWLFQMVFYEKSVS